MQDHSPYALKRHSKRISIVILVVFSFIMLVPIPEASAAGSLTLGKDTLVNNRPSVSTTLSTAVAVGNTTFNVASTTGILPNDVVTLVQGTPETVTVETIIDSTHFAATTAAAQTHTISSAVYMKQTSVHTIGFTTRSVVATGSFDVIFTGATTSTGVPTNQFDFNSLAGTDVSVTGFTAGTKTITAASGKVNIAFTSSIAASTAITITIGSTNKLLNPTKTAASGTADTWGVVINQNDATPGIVDATSILVATIESVSVTATVSPSLTFTINLVAGATPSIAGKTTSVGTTIAPPTVPFGTLTATVQKYAAHYLRVDTNAPSGYSVTTYEDGSLRKTSGTTIADFVGTADRDTGLGATANGFGFSLMNKTGTPCIAGLVYNFSGRTLNATPFGSSGTPTQIMSGAGAVTQDECYVVYDLQVAATQAPGDYQNLVTYIATATY